jgi:hypothetical protein
LKTALAPVVAAAAARFQPVTDSLSTSANQIPFVPTLLRYVLSALPQVGNSEITTVAPQTGTLQAEWDFIAAKGRKKAAIFVPLALSAQLTTSQPVRVKVRVMKRRGQRKSPSLQLPGQIKQESGRLFRCLRAKTLLLLASAGQILPACRFSCCLDEVSALLKVTWTVVHP